MKVEEALRQLPVARIAKRLRALWPAIEAKLSEGVPHADVLGFLNQNGFDLKECTYKTYLYRYRKEQRGRMSAGRHKSTTRPGVATPSAASLSSTDDSNRPATFDYDPRGIPDLLK